MRILVVSSFLPYPLFSGGHVRLYNLIKELSFKHKLTLVCEKRDYQSEKDVKEVEKFCEQVITVPRKKQWSLSNIIQSGFSQYPFLLVGHISWEMKHHIVTLLNEKHFDMIHVETFYINQNLPRTYLPVVLVDHNIEYLVYQRYVDTAPWYLRPFLFLDIKKLKYWEKFYWQKANRLVAVSEHEKKIMNRKDTVVVPNGVDIQKFKLQNSKLKLKKKEKWILFIGDFRWIQNHQAAEWILKEIWPKITEEVRMKKSEVVIKLWIVSKHIPEDLKSLGSAYEDILFDENAPDETWKIYQKASILLAPITLGGGTSYKILESMASGLAVVTTQFGIQGIGAQKNKEVLIGETAEELSRHVMSLLQDDSLYEKITIQARKLIEEKFSWKIIAKTLENVYESALR